MMLCPLKFSRYEFEGGEECIGAECGFYGSVCDMDMSVSVQKCPNELPEGDAVKELREFIDDQFVSGKAAWTQGMAIADMVERDYVRRDSHDFVVDALKYMKAEHDKWKAKAEQAKESSTHSKAQSKTEPKLSEQSESLSDESDSREKLEDDVGFIVKEGFVTYKSIIGWLDRQATITKAEQREWWGGVVAELQRQVDELTAQLHASNAERARLRECLGIATDNAHDLLTLVDESGNVYDRDEGLA